MRSFSPDVLRLTAAAVLGCALMASSSPARAASSGQRRRPDRERAQTALGEVTEAVEAGDVPRAAAAARRLVGSEAVPPKEVAELRMLLAGSRKRLPAGLVHLDAEIRAACAWAIGWIRDWEHAEEVEKLLADEAVPVRLEAARALGEFGEERFAAALRRASADPDTGVRAAALESLRRLGTGAEAAVRALEGLRELGDVPGDVLSAAAKLLAEIRPEDSGLKRRAALALEEALAHPQAIARWDVRFRIAAALGRLGIKEAVPALVRASHDPEERVALAAVAALGDVGGEEAARALVGIARAGGALASAAAESLGRAGVRSREVTDTLSGVLLEAPLETARAAAGALASLGGDAAREALFQASRSGRKEIYGPVAVAAAGLKDYRPAAVLLRQLGDEDVWTALGAARSLAEMDNAAGFPVFIEALRSEEERVRAFAATCLALYSGAHMDLWAEGPPSERERIAREWRRWWFRNRDAFAVRRPGHQGGPGRAR